MTRLLLSSCLLVFLLLPSLAQKLSPAVVYDQGRAIGQDSLALKNGNGFLGQIYNQSACGLNYCAADMMIATRYSPGPGPGFPSSLNISCLPLCSIQYQFVGQFIIETGQTMDFDKY